MAGATIRIFLADGTPKGLRVIEKSNWIGRGLAFERADWVRLRTRQDFSRPGVYVLFGQGDDNTDLAYVGEADELRKRITQHYGSLGFWRRAVAFMSRDQDLNKAHVRYLESHLIERAAAAKRSRLANGNAPPVPQLSESDEADAEAFLDEMLLILPLVGIDVFTPIEAPPATEPELRLTLRGTDARGYESTEGFIVRAGSWAAVSEVPSVHEYIRRLRAKLLSSGVLVPHGERLRFTQDYAFNSPSTASGVVMGRSSNGRADWKDASGRSLAQVQAETAKAVS
jgi:hypothetical protein